MSEKELPTDDAALSLAADLEDNARYMYDGQDPDKLVAAASELRRQHAEIERLRADANRLNWLRDKLFEHKWNGVVGKGCAVQWQVAGNFRFAQRELTDDSGIAAGDFRRAIDAAMAAGQVKS